MFAAVWLQSVPGSRVVRRSKLVPSLRQPFTHRENVPKHTRWDSRRDSYCIAPLGAMGCSPQFQFWMQRLGGSGSGWMIEDEEENEEEGRISGIIVR